MTRKISKKIRMACQIVERVGLATSSDLRPTFDRTENLSQLLNSAVAYGLMTASKATWPAQYRVMANWRQVVDARDLPAPIKPRPRQPASKTKYDTRALQGVWV